jgi:DNA-binding transcriptional MerR regulator
MGSFSGNHAAYCRHTHIAAYAHPSYNHHAVQAGEANDREGDAPMSQDMGVFIATPLCYSNAKHCNYIAKAWHMAKVSLNQASKDTGISLSTLSRWRKKGKISAEKTENGGYLIDTSEYDRIAELQKLSSHMQPLQMAQVTNIATSNDTPILELKITMLEKQLADKQQENDRLWQRLDAEAEERRKLTMLLSDMREKTPQTPPEKPKGFWATILGKNS